jgi:hypothetical protein
VAVESVGVHLLVARASTAAAWILTLLSLWGALWLLGDMHAVRLRPLRLAEAGLIVAVGIRWRAFVPYDAIRGVASGDPLASGPSRLAATVTSAVDLTLSLDREVEAHGLFGRRRRFLELALSVDRPEALARALRERSAAARDG